MSEKPVHIHDDVWEDLVQSELSPDEHAMLRALAEGDETVTAQLAAYTPLDNDYQERLTDRLTAKLEKQSAPRPSTRRRFALYSGASLAAAALALLMLWPNDPDLPEYQLSLRGSVAEYRGETEPASVSHARTFQPSSELLLTLTPGRAVGPEVQLATFVQSGGQLVPWQVPIERAQSGAFRIQGRVRELLHLPLGRHTLVLIVTPTSLDLDAAKQALAAGDLQVLRVDLTLVPEAVPETPRP